MAILRASEALMRIFQAEGVEYLFGLPGSTETQFMDSLEDHKEIKYILGLHECIAASMAVGYARASGKIAVINLHTFVGLGGAMAPLLDAQRAGIPLLVTAGNGDTQTAVREGGLTADLVGLGKTFSKWGAQVDYASNLVLTMRRAFKFAIQPPAGPVFISLPQNLMSDTLDFSYEPNPPQAFSTRRADMETIERAAAIIAQSRKPVIHLGPNVIKNQAVLEIVELAELTGAPVFIPGMASDTLFPSTHRQFMGVVMGNPSVRQFTDGADAIIAIGIQPPPGKNVIQIDNDPWELGKNALVAVAIDGDIKIAVAELASAIKKKMSAEDMHMAKDRANAVAMEKEKQKASYLKQAEHEREALPMYASRFAEELAKVITPEMVIVDESWSYSPTIMQYLDFPKPSHYFRHSGVSIGQGMPMALGVKLALPDKPVVALIGDGSAAWCPQTLWTASHYNLPVKFIIIHNASYRLVRQNKMRQLGEQVKDKNLGLMIDDPVIDFSALARSMGVKGQRVDEPSALASALKSALETNKPELIEVPVEGRI